MVISVFYLGSADFHSVPNWPFVCIKKTLNMLIFYLDIAWQWESVNEKLWMKTVSSMERRLVQYSLAGYNQHLYWNNSQ